MKAKEFDRAVEMSLAGIEHAEMEVRLAKLQVPVGVAMSRFLRLRQRTARQRLLDKVRGLAVGEALESLLARLLGVFDRLVVFIRHRPVMRQRRVVRRLLPLEPARETRVQIPPLREEHHLISGLLDDRVGEGARLPRHPGTHFDQFGRGQPLQHLRDPRAIGLHRMDRREGGRRKGAAHHARHFDRELLRRGKPVDAGADHALHRGGKVQLLKAAGVGRQAARAVLDDHMPGIAQCEGERLRKERMPIGASGDEMGECRGDRGDAETPADQRVHVFRWQPSELQQTGIRHLPRLLPGLGGLRPERSRRQHTKGLGHPVEDARDQLPRRRVQPLAIVEREDERPARRGALEQPHQRVGDDLRARLRGEARGRFILRQLQRQDWIEDRCQRRQIEMAPETREHRRRPLHASLILRTKPKERLEDPGPGRVAAREIAGLRPPKECEKSRAGRTGDHRGKKGGFSQPRFAFDEHRASTLAATQPRKPRFNLQPLASATNHAGDFQRSPRVLAKWTMNLDRVADSPQRHLPGWLETNLPTGFPDGRFIAEDFVNRQLHQAGAAIHGVTDHAVGAPRVATDGAAKNFT